MFELKEWTLSGTGVDMWTNGEDSCTGVAVWTHTD